MQIKSPKIQTEYKATVSDEGRVVLKEKKKIARGKKSKSSGNQFEARVRLDLEGKGWIVDKWSNNVDLDSSRLIPAKRKFNPFAKVMTIGTGFPDFVAFQKSSEKNYNIIGVEVKTNGTLSKIEKEKCKWYLEHNIFSQILIAKKVKVKNRVKVEYIEAEEILGRMKNKVALSKDEQTN